MCVRVSDSQQHPPAVMTHSCLHVNVYHMTFLPSYFLLFWIHPKNLLALTESHMLENSRNPQVWRLKHNFSRAEKHFLWTVWHFFQTILIQFTVFGVQTHVFHLATELTCSCSTWRNLSAGGGISDTEMIKPVCFYPSEVKITCVLKPSILTTCCISNTSMTLHKSETNFVQKLIFLNHEWHY